MYKTTFFILLVTTSFFGPHTLLSQLALSEDLTQNKIFMEKTGHRLVPVNIINKTPDSLTYGESNDTLLNTSPTHIELRHKADINYVNSEYSQKLNVSNTNDSDGDGVPDNMDMDDDNDGILDIDEGYSCQYMAYYGFGNKECFNCDTIGDGTSDRLNVEIGEQWVFRDFLREVDTNGHLVPGGFSLDMLFTVTDMNISSDPFSNNGNLPVAALGNGNFFFFLVENPSKDPWASFKMSYTLPGTAQSSNPLGTAAVINDYEFIFKDIDSNFSGNIDNFTEVFGVANADSVTIGNSLEQGGFVDESVSQNSGIFDLYRLKQSTSGTNTGVPNGLSATYDWSSIPNTGTSNIDNFATSYYSTYTGDEYLWGSTQDAVVNNNPTSQAVRGVTIAVNALQVCIAKDTDRDGRPDYLDLDSDGDGCPDAIEGDGSYDYDDLTTTTINGGNEGDRYNGFYEEGVQLNLGINVDINGIPDTDNNSSTDNSQGIGSSQDASISSCQSYLNFDGINDFISATDNFNINGWSNMTIQFWTKPGLAHQIGAGIIGQKGVIEITKEDGLSINLINGGSIYTYADAATLSNSQNWQHITVVFKDGELTVYLNGEETIRESTGLSQLGSSTDSFKIGAAIKSSGISNFYNGWIDEVKVFDIALTEDQLRQMIYQEIENNSGVVKGKTIPKDVMDLTSKSTIAWTNLKLYYQMGTTFTASGKVEDKSDNNKPGVKYNITTWQEETAPMPYVTSANGSWTSESTWLHGNVWDIEDVANNKDWSIVDVRHNVSTAASHTNLGILIADNTTLTLSGDNKVENTYYMSLDGTLDLLGDSQLVQKENSDLVTSASGKILRRQEGNSSMFWYNYWGSPVGEIAVTSLTDNNAVTANTNNTDASVSLLKQPNGSNFEYTSAYHEVGKISTRWLYTFMNGVTYYDWASLNPTTPIPSGVGYISKGTGVGTEQQYVFEGKPNNGTILVPVVDTGGSGSVPAVSKTDFLLGNPYPSAIDIHDFIDDNAGVISGTIRLWQQWSGSSHVLNEYNGGYADVNKLGSIRAYQFVGIEGANNGNQDGNKTPTRYMPVGQGFMAEIVADGNVVFRNSQRIFIKEADADGTYDNGSVFFRSAQNSNPTSNDYETNEDEESIFQKLRIELNSVDGPDTKRELLLGFSNNTTDDFDYGYDAKNAQVYADDLNLLMENDAYTIQAYSAVTNDKVVPLTLNASGTFNYTIKLTEIENFDEEQNIYLKDNLTGTYYDLRSEQPYEFLAEAGTHSNRLEIVFQTEAEALSVIDEIAEELKMYYSIGRKKLVVLNPNNTTIKQIEVINMLGQSAHRINNVHQGNYNEYNLNNIDTGTYIITLTTDTNAIISKKIVVK